MTKCKACFLLFIFIPVLASAQQTEKKVLYFKYGTVELTATSKSIIDDLFLKSPVEDILQVSLEGHTDGDGSQDFNLGLSRARVKMVERYIISKGITERLITASHFGKTKPIASNDTPSGKQKNRRVEIIILYENAASNNSFQSKPVKKTGVSPCSSPLQLTETEILYFNYGRHELTVTSKTKVNSLLKKMERKNISLIELAGHTDGDGGVNYNLRLSEERVTIVRNYLISAGIDAERLNGTYHGKNFPIAPNDTEAGKQKNRRVEMVIQFNDCIEKENTAEDVSPQTNTPTLSSNKIEEERKKTSDVTVAKTTTNEDPATQNTNEMGEPAKAVIRKVANLEPEKEKINPGVILPESPETINAGTNLTDYTDKDKIVPDSHEVTPSIQAGEVVKIVSEDNKTLNDSGHSPAPASIELIAPVESPREESKSIPENRQNESLTSYHLHQNTDSLSFPKEIFVDITQLLEIENEEIKAEPLTAPAKIGQTNASTDSTPEVTSSSVSDVNEIETVSEQTTLADINPAPPADTSLTQRSSGDASSTGNGMMLTDADTPADNIQPEKEAPATENNITLPESVVISEKIFIDSIYVEKADAASTEAPEETVTSQNISATAISVDDTQVEPVSQPAILSNSDIEHNYAETVEERIVHIEVNVEPAENNYTGNSLNEILKEADSANSSGTISVQTFTLPAAEEIVINGARGTTIRISENSLVDKNGSSVHDTVTIKLQEVYTKADMVNAGIGTTADGKLLESGGMVNVEITSQDNQDLFLAKNASYLVELPTGTKQEDMTLFYGDRPGGNPDWQLADRTTFDDSTYLENQKLLDKYVFKSSQLGWINVDRFVGMNEKTNLRVNPGAENNANVCLVFKRLNSVINMTNKNKEIMFSHIPLGEEATLVAFSKKEDEILFASKDIIIDKDMTETLVLEKLTEAEFQEKLKKLN